MGKRVLFLLGFMHFGTNVFTQSTLPNWGIGMEAQAYPTGQIFGLTFEKILSQKDALHLRLGYNRVRHGDAGVHDEETGGGFGFTLGYRRYFSNTPTTWHLGFRNDCWFNTIDWKDFKNSSIQSGTSKILVIQPILEGGYLFSFKNNWILDLSLAFGVEINAKTKGEPTGEGLILLGGVTFGKRKW
jgi:hypothetical protein